LTKISDKADDVEPNYTDDSTCIQEADNGTCEVQRDGLETSIGMPERYNAYIHTKSTAIVWNLLRVYAYAAI
jgi:hypothetical protein